MFIFMVGVFMSSWFIKRMPFVRRIYYASRQICVAIYPGQNTQAFKEVDIIRHHCIGEYAFGFITSFVILQVSLFLGRFIFTTLCKLHSSLFLCIYFANSFYFSFFGNL
ncbi:hypothetical protein R6Q59_035487 [Mikania micrantha]